jgi:hypothetical protein
MGARHQDRPTDRRSYHNFDSDFDFDEFRASDDNIYVVKLLYSRNTEFPGYTDSTTV